MNGLKASLVQIQKKAIERTVKTTTIEYDLETLVKKIERKVIKLNPEYQRNHRWEKDFSSRLIESLILNIPIPLIYISQDVDVDDEDEEGTSRYSVIDGQQRLTAIFDFFKNSYALVGLEILKELNGSNYKDLPPFLTRRLEERTLRCLRIDSTVDRQVKFDIFERLNTGSVKLEAQELRNATCRGPFNYLLKELAKNEDFRVITQIKPDSNRVKKMEDEELVLRFFAIAFKDGYKDYKGGFKSFLTEKMEHFNMFSDSQIIELSTLFLNTMGSIRERFGDMPFAKFKNANKRMSTFNAAVYDSVVVPFSSSQAVSEAAYENFLKLFSDPEYFNSVEGSVTDVSKLITRIKKGKKAIIQ